MKAQATLFDLQASVQDKSAFGQIEDYYTLSYAYLNLLAETQPTRIISPNDHRYMFYQYGEAYRHKITRPLNSDLFIVVLDDFQAAFERLISFLADLKQFGQAITHRTSVQKYLETNKVVLGARDPGLPKLDGEKDAQRGKPEGCQRGGAARVAD